MAKRKTDKEFKEELLLVWEGKLESLTPYGKNVHEKVLIKCNQCNTEFYATPVHLLSKTKPTGCKECAKKRVSKKQTLSKEQLLEKIYKLVGDEYTIVDWLDYKKTSDKVLFKHNKCGSEFSMTMNNFLSGQRCPNERYTNHAGLFKSKEMDYYLAKLKNVDDFEEYAVQSDILGANKKFTLKHLVCNKEYDTTVYRFLEGKRCPHCSKRNNSKPVKLIKKLLDENNIPYTNEKSFSDLVSPFSSYHLRFDFYIPSLNTVIEYDGEFHEKVFSITSEEKVSKQQKLDKIKDKYCKENNIKIIRINYKEKNKIPEIIEKFLKSTTIM